MEWKAKVGWLAVDDGSLQSRVNGEKKFAQNFFLANCKYENDEANESVAGEWWEKNEENSKLKALLSWMMINDCHEFTIIDSWQPQVERFSTTSPQSTHKKRTHRTEQAAKKIQ